MSDRARPDTLGLWEGAASMPEQLTSSVATATDALADRVSFAAGPTPSAVAAFGLGSAATACEAVGALCAAQMPVPFWIGRGTELPAFVDAGTLVLAVSSSGATTETLDAASASLSRGARLVAVGGGPADALARLATDAGERAVWCPTPPSSAGGRSALGALIVPALQALAAVGLTEDWSDAVAAASASLARRRDAFGAPDGPAAEVARRIGRTFPLVCGTTGIGAVAARWWKEEINRNAKSPAFASDLTSVVHGELSGWGQSGDVTRQVMTLVLLRHAGEPPRTAASFAAVKEATDEVMAVVLEVEAVGDDALGRFFDLVLLGELVSLHLAAREGVDPGPTPALDGARAELPAS